MKKQIYCLCTMLLVLFSAFTANGCDCEGTPVSTNCSEQTLVYYDANDACIGNYSNFDVFTPAYPSNGQCQNITASTLFSLAPPNSNGAVHSCVVGAGNADYERALCLPGHGGSSFVNNEDNALRFTITVNPSQLGEITELSFYQMSGYDTPPNPYLNRTLTKFGVRVLKDGQEIFKQVNIPTSNCYGYCWEQEVFDFSNNPAFSITTTTTFEFELLGYAPIAYNSDQVRMVMDFDEIKLKGCCSNNDPCLNQGGDSDGDGICNNQDCQPNNPAFPATPGSSCNDGNSNTNNDVVTADGCGCAGTPVGNTPDCNDISITNGSGSITVSGLDGAPISQLQIFNSSWQTEFQCGGDCNATETVSLTSGTYQVYVKYYSANWQLICQEEQTITVTGGSPCENQGGDSDNDGTCNNDDCQPNNPAFPATPGSSCNDGNSNTNNDVVTADGCGCAGTPVASSCSVTTGNCSITITGLSSTDYTKVFDSNWSIVWDCNPWVSGGCNSTETITGLENGTYHVQACGQTESYTISGCGSTDPCDNQGGDSDNDGTCNNDDCQPNNPAFPATPGSSCNDGNSNTNNDVVTADGCGCAGTPVGNTPDCNDISITNGSGSITVSGLDGAPISQLQIFNSSWQTEFQCGGDCNATETVSLTSGTYQVYVKYYSANWQLICQEEQTITVTGGSPCGNQGGDSDNDGTCNNDDCQPNNPAFPATPGSSCNDGNSNTNNDVVTADGCGCAGTPVGNTPDCNDISITNGSGSITVSGLDGAPISQLQIFNSSWQTEFQCGGDCNATETVSLTSGTYQVYVKYYSANWQLICQEEQTITVTGGSPCGNQGGDSDNDGTCNNDDCQPNNPAFPATPGSSCNDGNSNTNNDVVTADGCGCAGTPVASSCSVTTGNCSITITGLSSTDYTKVFDSNWSIVWDCNPWVSGGCNSTETITGLENGTYHVQACGQTESYTISGCGSTDPCDNQGGDSDNDGTCNNDDCQPNNPAFPATPGSSCNDGNSNTNNDVVTADGCGCAGTPVASSCSVTTGNCSITITGLSSTDYTKVFDSNWSIVWDCNPWVSGGCNSTETITGLENGTYHVQACGQTESYTISGCSNGGGDNISLNCPADFTLDPVPGNLVTFVWPEVTGSTDCGSGGLTIIQTEGPSLGQQLNASNNVYTMTFEATDDCGNSTTCSFTITDEIWTATIEYTSCPNNISVEATSANGALVTWDEPILFSDCPDGQSNSIVQGMPSGSLFPIGTTQIVYQSIGNGVGNGCGVQDVCVFDVTVTEGQTGSCNVTTSDCSITLSGLGSDEYAKVFDASWNIVWDCNPWVSGGCNTTETITGLENGTYHVQACGQTESYTISGCGSTDPCDNQGGDSDNDGTCDNQDCQPNNANFPATPGTPCNDGNSNTNNDVVTANGCDCEGTPVSINCSEQTLVYYDANDACIGNYSNFDVFTPAYPSNGQCQNITASTLFSLAPPNSNGAVHSCVVGAGNADYERALCLPGHEGSSFVNNEDNALRFTITVNPSQLGEITELSFYQMSGYDTPPNPYLNRTLTKFGVRVLKDGQEIFKQVNIPTSNCYGYCWEQEVFDFSNNPAFSITTTTTFEFELLGYAPIAYNSDQVRMVMDFDEIKLKGCCNSSGTPLESQESEAFYFNAQKDGRDVALYWVTNTEYKNDYFEVERSFDGVNFELMEEVLSTSESTDHVNYSNYDDDAKIGANYYRIKQIFKDGTFTYSGIRQIDFELDLHEFAVFPNPTAQDVYINLKDFVGKSATIQIHNALGTSVHMDEISIISTTPVYVSLANIPSGVYVVSVKVEGRKLMTRTLIVQRL